MNKALLCMTLAGVLGAPLCSAADDRSDDVTKRLAGGRYGISRDHVGA